MDQELPKICPKCRQKDVTSFSTCKFCGTKYDAKIPKPKSEFDWRIKLKLSAILILVGVVLWCVHSLQSFKAKQLASLRKSIKAVSRPRMIEFYSPSCGACQAYEPIVDQCQAKYGATIDFQRLKYDDKSNSDLEVALSVDAIPKTCIFNRKGEEVYEQTGCLDLATLDKHLQDAELLK